MNTNNRLKFRAWDGYELIYSDNKNSLEAFFGITDDKGYGDFRTVYQQSTGLKDKNGKDIYEGDIIKWNAGWFYQKEHVGEVKWMENGFFYISEKNCYNSKIFWRLGNDTDGQIVGNTFENPKLLNS